MLLKRSPVYFYIRYGNIAPFKILKQRQQGIPDVVGFIILFALPCFDVDVVTLADFYGQLRNRPQKGNPAIL